MAQPRPSIFETITPPTQDMRLVKPSTYKRTFETLVGIYKADSGTDLSFIEKVS